MLYDGYTFRRREVDAEHGDGVLVRRISIFARVGEEISGYLSGDYPNRAVAAGDAVMTPAQREALDEVQRIAASPDTYLDMSIGEGDIQFLNNRLLLHGRTGYEDHPDMARRRHLLRLWLRVPDWPAQPSGQAMHTRRITRCGCVSVDAVHGGPVALPGRDHRPAGRIGPLIDAALRGCNSMAITPAII